MLYYPFFNAPPPVLYQAVLYWDSIATVVASEWEDRISDPMREVYDAGLYRPIAPYSAFEPLPAVSIEAELEHVLETVPIDDLMPPGDEFDERYSVLHLDKLDDSLADLLRSLGLVREIPSMPWRLIASPTLVHLVVSILADQIARQANDRLGFTAPTSLRPHTDVPLAHRLALKPVEGRPTASCWNVDIGALLPVPTNPVPIGQLVRFRASHDEERQAMMHAIDDLLMGLSQGQHPHDVFDRVKRELADATAALHAAARSANWWAALDKKRSIKALVTAGTAYLGGDLLTSSATGALATAALTVVGSVAINIATDSTRSEVPAPGSPARYRYLHSVRHDITA
jgi:hypothetical protein